MDKSPADAPLASWQPSNEALRFLLRASETLGASLEYEDTLAHVAQLAVPEVADWCAVDILENGSLRRLAVAHVDPEKVAWAHALHKQYPPNPEATTGVYSVLRSGQSALYPEVTDEIIKAAALDEEHLRIMRQIGFTSAMTVPLKLDGDAFGAITFVTAESGRRYTQTDLTLAEELARRAAFAVERARLYHESHETSEWFRTTLASIGDAVIATDIEGRITLMNRVAETLTGYTQAEAKGQALETVFRIINQESRQPVESPVTAVFRHGNIVGLANHTLLIRKDGSEIAIDDSGAPIRDEAGALRGVVLVFRDINERYKAERLRNTQYEVTRILAEAGTLEEAQRDVVQTICDLTGWRFGELWRLDEAAQVLRLVNSWPLERIPPSYYENSRHFTFSKGEGLVGRVWAEEQAVWLENIADNPQFNRRDLAVQERLRCAFAFPICVAQRVVGVMTFFSDTSAPADLEFMRLMDALGSQIGDHFERKHAEEELRRSREQLQAILDGVADGITVQGADGRFVYVNHAAAHTSGYATPEEMLAASPSDLRSRHDLYYEDGTPFPRKQLPGRLALEGLEPAPVTLRYHSSYQPGERWSSLKATPIRDERGRVLFAINIFHDLTEHKVAAAQILAEKHFSDTLIDSLPGIFYLFGEDGQLLRWNKQLEQVSGYPSDTVVGMHPLDFFADEDKPDIIEKINDVFNHGESSIEVSLVTAEGQTLPYFFTGRRLLLEDAPYVLGVGLDMRERHEAEARLRESEAALRVARDALERRVEERTLELLTTNRQLSKRTVELEALNKELEAFSYSVSHDLRAPLRGLDGFSQALLEEFGDQLDETASGYLQRIRNAAQRMGVLIDALLNLSRLSRSEMKLETVKLSAIAGRIAQELELREPERKVTFEIQDDMEAQGDERLLTILLENLLANAYKFTRNESDARISFRSEANDKGHLFTLQDNGAGFNMDYANKLFGAFQRLHAQHEFEGTGIGLANVQRIVHRHGGRIWAEGKEGEGATFYFTLAES